jgi:nitroreductase
MEFFDMIKSRRSVRAFAPKPVEEDKLNQILEAINRAPSAGNLQGFEIYLVRKPWHRKALADAAPSQEYLATAPVVLAFCTNPARLAKYGERGEQLFCVQDATIAAVYAWLALTDLVLSGVWIGSIDEEEARRALGAPVGQRPVVLMPIGYSADNPVEYPRRPLSDLVHEV